MDGPSDDDAQPTGMPEPILSFPGPLLDIGLDFSSWYLLPDGFGTMSEASAVTSHATAFPATTSHGSNETGMLPSPTEAATGMAGPSSQSNASEAWPLLAPDLTDQHLLGAGMSFTQPALQLNDVGQLYSWSFTHWTMADILGVPDAISGPPAEFGTDLMHATIGTTTFHTFEGVTDDCNPGQQAGFTETHLESVAESIAAGETNPATEWKSLATQPEVSTERPLLAQSKHFDPPITEIANRRHHTEEGSHAIEQNRAPGADNCVAREKAGRRLRNPALPTSVVKKRRHRRPVACGDCRMRKKRCRHGQNSLSWGKGYTHLRWEHELTQMEYVLPVENPSVVLPLLIVSLKQNSSGWPSGAVKDASQTQSLG